ncbi:MarR family winged helix-turn-helix transcriptional regulator [Marinobacter sp. JSM 1782161]|uniref:MarR family winged helix-turn-helix transcriptional regulator n=1 Tax=Marinobacter sp. JSM 1782161 TaxID=2685906 RepID=UPI00140423F0|nr:MarR family transcriptional regulator [Marinobacter sp. JSM 1782161]
MDQRLFYLLNMARQRVYNVADQRTESALGISVTQLGALFLIGENEGCLLKEVARGLHLNNSALTGLTGRMAQNGLIERRPCEQDKRATRLYLTELGRSRIDAARPLVRQFNDALSDGFSDAEMQVILRFLNRLVNEF